MDTVDEEVNTGETTRHERPPPPVIILSEVIKSFSQQNLATVSDMYWRHEVLFQNFFMEKTYLCTQVEITQKYGGLTTCDDKDKEHQEQESKHVIHLMRPV